MDELGIAKSLKRDGFVMCRWVFSPDVLGERVDCVSPVLCGKSGFRDPVRIAPELKTIVDWPALQRLVRALVGSGARPIQMLLFDKTAQRNWPVPWHQDATVPFVSRADAAGFGPWTVKGGVPHARAPASVLDKLLIARVHFDPCNKLNGALHCVPGSHQLGLIPSDRIAECVDRLGSAVCDAAIGDVFFMRPLVVHRSGRAVEPEHRRVLQIEYAEGDAPVPLEWRSVI
jgi:hypothetical protein